MKRCRKCEIEKEEALFSKGRHFCKECEAVQRKRHREDVYHHRLQQEAVRHQLTQLISRKNTDKEVKRASSDSRSTSTSRLGNR